MRRCFPSDLIAAARLVAAAEQDHRIILTDQLICQSDAAHRYAKRFGRAHPFWGNGSLMSRALLAKISTPISEQSADFLVALALVANALAQRKTSLFQ